MDLMDRRRLMMAMNVTGGLPDFFNHLDYGSFSVDSGGSKHISTPSIITCPKGLVVYTNELDINPPEEGKVKGSYAAIFIAGSELPPYSDDHYDISVFSSYAVNWGSYTYPIWRSSRTESRGIYFYYPNTKEFVLRGFGSGDYDFKYGVTYNWIAWD